jgi:phospholipid/cholesterol/gamma-HCH transport system ATP-binding protein
MRNVAYEADGQRILDDITLDIHGGEIVAVMGGSGSGKTSLLRVMMGLVRPAEGTVEVLGEDITAQSEDELNHLRRRMGFVFQYSALFDSLTVAENVGFALYEKGELPPTRIAEIVAEKLALVGLEGIEERMPDQLSGGMQKRVGMARALAVDPHIMLYDEPTSGLDPISADQIDALIRRLRDQLGVTSVIVSHDVASMCALADRAAMLSDGRIIAVGTTEELTRSELPVVRQFVSRCLVGRQYGAGAEGGQTQ